MNAEDLRKLLEQTDDKLGVFLNRETLNQYNFTAGEIVGLIADFLNDEEKLHLFDTSHFLQANSYIKRSIIEIVSDDQTTLKMINNDSIVEGITSYELTNIIKNMGDSGKQQVLYNKEFLDKHQIDQYGVTEIISTLTDEAKTTILLNKDLISNKLQLTEYQIGELIKEISSDDIKEQAIETYQIEGYKKTDIIKTYSSERKVDILLKETEFRNSAMIDILQTLDAKTLCEFLNEHKEFCTENKIVPYKIIMNLDADRQKEVIGNLENIGLNLNEKREILATLRPDVKESIDVTNFPEEYKLALSMQAEEFSGKIILDFERDIEDYRGLDNLIRVNPEVLTEDQKAKLMKICDICPEMTIVSGLDNNLVTFESNVTEFREAEKWIKSVIDSLEPEWSNAQKMAVIDNAIGKRISYSPDFGTEVFDGDDCRAMYRIISSGYGVCNGIAKVEHHILSRVGIDSEIVGSGRHSFLKIKDIEIPLANGEIAKGNTILDPTWNLTDHRFGGRPTNFCMSYEQARKNDIDSEGRDHKCHLNDEALQDATLNLDEQSLRRLFTSAGLADREGNFPVKELLEKSKEIDNLNANDPEQNISNQLLLLSEICPEFATCQNSSMQILKGLLLGSENLSFDRSAINRVYDRTDKEKRPSVYVYLCSDELGEKFYIPDKELGQFVELPKEEFVEKYECYEEDLKAKNGLRPWEIQDQEQEKEEINLATSSGRIVAEEEPIR